MTTILAALAMALGGIAAIILIPLGILMIPTILRRIRRDL